MSALRRGLKRPETYLAILALLAAAAILDARRAPRSQVTAQIYLSLLGRYQSSASPLLRGLVSCRYLPTCSEYSRTAVERHGIHRGFTLTMNRIWRCRRTVPAGTPDAVPDQDLLMRRARRKLEMP